VEEMFLAMVTKFMDIHVLPKFTNVAIDSTSFVLWMSKGGVDTFALVINYLTKAWEVNETTDSCMAQQLQSLFEKFGLIHQVLAFIKDVQVIT
jgi:hypothetical protein